MLVNCPGDIPGYSSCYLGFLERLVTVMHIVRINSQLTSFSASVFPVCSTYISPRPSEIRPGILEMIPISAQRHKEICFQILSVFSVFLFLIAKGFSKLLMWAIQIIKHDLFQLQVHQHPLNYLYYLVMAYRGPGTNTQHVLLSTRVSHTKLADN